MLRVLASTHEGEAQENSLVAVAQLSLIAAVHFEIDIREERPSYLEKAWGESHGSIEKSILVVSRRPGQPFECISSFSRLSDTSLAQSYF
jgi:hypothetical protein